MIITSGKHKGRSVEQVVLKDPLFVRSFLLPAPGCPRTRHVRLREETRRVVAAFDRRRFVVRCFGRGCESVATRCTLRCTDVDNPWWWCDRCDPYQYGAGKDMLTFLSTYRDCIEFALEAYEGEDSVAEDLVMAFSQAKGLPPDPTADQIDLFFNG